MSESDSGTPYNLSPDTENSANSDETEETFTRVEESTPKRQRLILEKDYDEPEGSPRTEKNLRIFAFDKIGENISSPKSDKKFFICTFCKYRTAHYSNLYVHMRTHTGEKPYFCGACGHRASQGSTLKTHIKSRHEGNINEYYNLDCDLRVKLRPIAEGNSEIIIAPIINDEIVTTESQLNSLRSGFNETDFVEKHEPTSSAPCTTSTPQVPQNVSQTPTTHGIPNMMPQFIPGVSIDPFTMSACYFFYQQMMAQQQTPGFQAMQFMQNMPPSADRQIIMRQALQLQSYQQLQEMYTNLRNFSSVSEGTSEPAETRPTPQHTCNCTERLTENRISIRALAIRLAALDLADPELLEKILAIVHEMNNLLR